jgi:hypothetical protein
MSNHISPNYFEARLAAAIARSDELPGTGNSSVAAKAKLYSKNQLCRDEAYKKPGFAQAAISAGIEYGAFVEIEEVKYLEICKQFAYTPEDIPNLQLIRKEELKNNGSQLPKIMILANEYSCEANIQPEQGFDKPIDFKAAGDTIKAYTQNLFIVDK